MLRAVLDTNVVVSAHLRPEGQQALIIGLAFGRKFRWFVSEALLEEYQGVLRRQRFGLNPKSVTQSIRLIRKTATLVVPKKRLSVTRDPDDNKAIECALEARTDYVVTGNIPHFPSHYHRSRTHLSLGKDAPEPRAIQPPEMESVVALPQVGGLHHRYERRAA